ncbi:hypothetical protein GOODEAATRI_008212 [Goodea atripinnis]|uniref:Uncharacterized protein n=1 Tax=Goodea atripinnis TaxID=208336 RepID=A0ABV0MZM3_9TELE
MCTWSGLLLHGNVSNPGAAVSVSLGASQLCSLLSSCATTTITATATQAGLLLGVTRAGQGEVWTVDLPRVQVFHFQCCSSWFSL